MATKQNIDPAEIEAFLHEEPIKAQSDVELSIDQLREQADLARQFLVPVSYTGTYGTCIDERARAGLLSGEPVIEPRAAAVGGPNVYGLLIAELTGVFSEENATADNNLHRATRLLEAASIGSGGHVNCAANAGVPNLMAFIADNPDAIESYTSAQRGPLYNPEAMQSVFAFARRAVDTQRYKDWSEANLQHELGAEAGQAIERLADVPHEAFVVYRVHVDGMTIDQTGLYQASVCGKGGFVHDEGYADAIEAAITSGPNAVRDKEIAEHAREAILVAVTGAVPNNLLYQVDVRA